MSAPWPHANCADWWDGPERFKQVNRCEVATIQNETLLLLLNALIPGPPRERVTLVADACRPLPYPAGHFSLVFSSHTIEHVHDANGFLTEADRLLCPGGYFYLVCPDRLHDPHNCDSDKLGERSYEEFTPQELRERVGQCLPGYEILSFDTRKNNYDFEIFMRKPLR